MLAQVMIMRLQFRSADVLAQEKLQLNLILQKSICCPPLLIESPPPPSDVVKMMDGWREVGESS